MKNSDINLKYRKKVIIIFIEYFVFALFFQLNFSFFKTIGFSNFITILLLSYFIYYSLFEFLFNKSLVMRIFNVELDKQKKSNIHFVLYFISSILDRTLFLPFHMLLTIMNYENLLLCEKLSGIKWNLKRDKHSLSAEI
jgi:hypothetical protein